MKSRFITMSEKNQKQIVVVCKGIESNHKALILEWDGSLDVVTTMCQDEWGSGVFRKISGIFYAWDKDKKK